MSAENLQSENARDLELAACFSSPLAFLSPLDAAKTVLLQLGKVLAIDRAALLWKEEQSRTLQGISWECPDTVTIVRLPLSPHDSISQLASSQLATDQLPEPLTLLNWNSIVPGDVSGTADEILLGLVDPHDHQRLPPAWREVLPGILRWSMQFEQILRDRTLAALAEYAAGAGHEINNPLGSIIGRTSQLLKTETNREKRRLLEAIGAQAYRIGDMIGDTMLFANPPASRPQSVSLTETVQTVLHHFGSQIVDSQIHLSFLPTEAVFVHADPVQLHIVVSELVRNSLNALLDNPPESPRMLTVHCTCEERQGRTGGLLELIDTGPGLTPEQQQHCFDPFYSGRQAGRGLGFGLSKCWRIVQQHQGTISLCCEDRQTRVQVWMVSDAKATSPEAP